MKDTEQYKALPAKVSSTVLLMVQHNFKSYFKATAEYYKNPYKFLGRPKLPKYLNVETGRFFVSYTNQAFSKKVFKKSGNILLSKTNIEFKTKIKDIESINCIRIVPKDDHFVIEVIYTIEDVKPFADNQRYASVDLGVNNLMAITSNCKGVKPVVVNGRPLKSINQFYNKELARKTSILETRNKVKKSKGTVKLTNKRKRKIDNYLHKSANELVNHCKKNNINTVVIGKNDNWKQDVSMSKKNNQGFVNIPHSRLIDMIKYKCEIGGINIIIQEESYTSKASFLNQDPIPVYKDGSDNHVFSGYRESRGMYKIKGEKRRINADVNGSYNILRKAVPNVFTDGIEGVGVCPEVIKISK
jgi:putative transposase